MTIKMMDTQHFQPPAHLIGYDHHHQQQQQQQQQPARHYRAQELHLAMPFKQQQQQQQQDGSDLITSTVPDVDELMSPMPGDGSDECKPLSFNPVLGHDHNQQQNELAFRQIQITTTNDYQQQQPVNTENYPRATYATYQHHHTEAPYHWNQQQPELDRNPNQNLNQNLNNNNNNNNSVSYSSLNNQQAERLPSVCAVGATQQRQFSPSVAAGRSPRSSCSPASSIVVTNSSYSTSSSSLSHPVRPPSNISSYTCRSEDVFLTAADEPQGTGDERTTTTTTTTKASRTRTKSASKKLSGNNNCKQQQQQQQQVEVDGAPSTGRVVVKRIRRVKANDRERNRMHNLNEALDRLRQHLPGGKEDNKMTKIETLKSAQEYIQRLAKLLADTKNHSLLHVNPAFSASPASSFTSSSSSSSSSSASSR